MILINSTTFISFLIYIYIYIYISNVFSLSLILCFTVYQVWVFLLVIFFSPLQVSSAETKKESAEIGSCRFDLTSVAALSCVELDGSWRPPSMSCCNALLYAIDHVPASNESGVCCLCRYMSQKYSHFALAVLYVLCKGKDRSIVTTWSSVPHNCYTGMQLCSVSIYYSSLR